MKINTAGQTVGVQMISTAIGATGLAFASPVMVYVTGDNGTMATAVGAASATHKGFGFHTYTPTATETNYTHVAFTFATTGAQPQTVQMYTTYPQTGDAFLETQSQSVTIQFLISELPTAAYVVSTLLATPIETGVNVAQTLRLMNAANAGKSTGMDTGSVVIRDINDTKNRIQATTDASGNRFAVTTSLD